MKLLLKTSLRLLAVFVIAMTALPFVPTDEWWVRVCDFPRLQIAVTGGGLLLLAVVGLRKRLRGVDWALTGFLAAAVAVQVWLILPYTRVAPEQVRAAANSTPENTLRLFVANVLIDNRNSDALLELIRAEDPDVILLTETDDWWVEQCRPLEDTHRFTVLQPQENGYGMTLYSRLELIAPEVFFRIEPAVPSIRVDVRLRGGQLVGLHGVHPRPPGIDPPGPKDRQDSGPRDAELLVIARELKSRGGPAIVAGDFNDVAWSHTSRLLQRIGGLLDPRVGRGLYNTFDATLPLLRYPLDHVLQTEHFTLAEMRRLPNFGSDHFAMLVALCYEPHGEQPRGAPTPKPDDRREAEESVEKER